jgi:hypothetical protein
MEPADRGSRWLEANGGFDDAQRRPRAGAMIRGQAPNWASSALAAQLLEC